MNAQRLLAAFSKIGDDPDRIQQLRKIAVALAISGKLDNGAASMTPSELLHAVNRVKAALAKQGAIPKPKRMEEVTAEQLPADFTDPTRFAPLGLCCTNRLKWDSSRESSVVAGVHEQTHTPCLQDQELARVQRSAEAPWLADDLV